MKALALQMAALSLTCIANASADELRYPLSAAATSDGAVYVADRKLPGIWKLDGRDATAFFTADKKFGTPLNSVRSVAIDANDRLYAADPATREIYRFDQNGKPVALTGGMIGTPVDLAFDSRGNLFVSDLETHRIWKIAAEGRAVSKFAEIPSPRGLAIDAEDRLWVISHGKQQLVRVAPDGTIETVIDERPFRFPQDVAVAKDGTAFVSDSYSGVIWKVDASGEPTQWASGDPLVGPVGLAWKDETLLIADPQARAVFAADAQGRVTNLIPAEGSHQ